MPIMSRFRKDKKDGEEPDGAEADLKEGEEAGLFMANSSQQDQPAAEEEQAEADDLLEASSGEAATLGEGSSEKADDLVSETPAPTTEAEADTSESPRPSTEEETKPAAPTNVKTVAASEGATDDLMSAFRGGTVESEVSTLMKDIEDVPAEELLTDMREIMEILGLTLPEIDDEEDGAEDGAEESEEAV